MWTFCAVFPIEWNESITWLPLCINSIAHYLSKKIKIFVVTEYKLFLNSAVLAGG